MAKFIAHVSTWRVGSEYTVPFEIPDDELEDLNEHERDELLNEAAQTALEGYWEWGWTEDEN